MFKKKSILFLLGVVLAGFLAACGGEEPVIPEGNTPRPRQSPSPVVLPDGTTATPAPKPTPVGGLVWGKVTSFAYQLHNVDLEALGKTEYDMAILDIAQDGKDETRYTVEQIDSLRNSPGSRKLLLAYMNIGQAENNRSYWKSDWPSGAPSWLGPVGTTPNNFHVRYWEEGWQALLYGKATSYIDKVMEAGFDGVYLAGLDEYSYWAQNGESGLNRQTAERDMVDLVKAISRYVRVANGLASFGVFIQNGDRLITQADLLGVVTGVARENIWYTTDGKAQTEDFTKRVLTNLDGFKKAGKPILAIEYVSDVKQQGDVATKARSKNYVLFNGPKTLDSLAAPKP